MSRPGTILKYGSDEIEQLYRMCQARTAVMGGGGKGHQVIAAQTFLLSGTDAERRAQADAIVASMGATAGFEGGFYSASMPGLETLTIKLEFVPPIPATPEEGGG